MKRHFALCIFLVGLVARSAFAANATSPLLPKPDHAVARVAMLQVLVTPDRADWTYALGAPVKFQIRVLADHVSLEGVVVSYRVGPEMMPAEERRATTRADGVTIDAGTLQEPGFLRCIATVEHEGRVYRGLATAGFAPEKIRPTQTEPADFDAFWKAGVAELAKLPLDAQLTPLPDQGTSRIEVFHVSFRNVGVGSTTFPSPHTRIYGILCVPRGAGPFPALVRFPGAAVRAYTGVKDLAERGFLTLEIGVHGIPVNQPSEIYAQLVGGALASYPTYNLDNPKTYYYRRVYLGAIRANDFMCSLPQWDRRTLIASGHSQGGQLAIVAAALDPRVTAVQATFPAFCDVTGYLHGRAGGWPHMFRDEAAGHRTPAKIATTAYYDTVNFARRLKQPGFYTWGYNDETCPPTSMFAAYNTITAPKQFVLALETGHGEVPEQFARINEWLLAQAQARTTP